MSCLPQKLLEYFLAPVEDLKREAAFTQDYIQSTYYYVMELYCIAIAWLFKSHGVCVTPIASI